MEENLKKNIYINTYVTESLCCILETHCKSTVFQLKKKSIMDLLFRLITFCARNLMRASRYHMHRAWRSRLSSFDGKDFKASMTKEQ